jgi:hypothetical protein
MGEKSLIGDDLPSGTGEARFPEEGLGKAPA